MGNWKKTPVFKKWQTNVSRHRVRKTKKRSEKDMCKDAEFCKGAKNIPRKLMPQIYDATKFAKIIKKKYNVDSVFTKAAMGDYFPSQNEINEDRVNGVIGAIKKRTLDSYPLVVSEDRYIIDGHHRWAAYKKLSPNKPVDVLVVKKPVNEALGLAIAVGTEREHFG
jgi:disulfide oxidoreductase YuzD